MSLKINKETVTEEKNPSLNLVAIIEKYYLPKDISLPTNKISKSQNLDTDLSDYLSLLSTSQKNINIKKNIIIKSKEIKKENNSKNIIITPEGPENNINKTNNDFNKIFRNYIAPYFTLKDLIALKHSNKMFNFLIDKKVINSCTISNTIKPIKSRELRAKIWYHLMNYSKKRKKN